MLAPAHTPALPAGLPLLDRTAAADLARVSLPTLQRWRAAGALPVVRIGSRVLFRRSAVLAYTSALASPHADHSGHRAQATATAPEPATLTAEAAAELLSVEEVRRALAISSSTLSELIRTGALPSCRVHNRRLVRAGDLATFVDQHAEAATAGPLAGRLA